MSAETTVAPDSIGPSAEQLRAEADALAAAIASKRKGQRAFAARSELLQTAVLLKEPHGWDRLVACRYGNHGPRADALARAYNAA
jgi:hypothetical protein